MKADNSHPACRRFTRDHPELTRIFAAQNDHFTTDMDTPEDARRLGIRFPPNNTIKEACHAMKITGENIIAANKETVWQGLNDPEVLRQAIPGCEELQTAGENAFKATVTTRIGPVSARFEGQVSLSDLNPPMATHCPVAGRPVRWEMPRGRQRYAWKRRRKAPS